MALQQHQLLPAEIQGERACSQSSISTQSVQACVQCRRQHLKCDAVVPVCTRCQSTGEECRYVKSKRGGKRIRKPAEQETRPDSMPNTAQVSLDPWNRPFIEPNSHVHLVTQATSVRSTADADNIHHRSDCCPSLIRIPASHISFQSRSPFHNQLPEYIRSYYDSFHDAHPYVLPQACLMKRLERDDAKEMESLVTAIGFIGLCYSSPAKAESAIVATTSLLLENELPKTGFTVQALLLFSLALTFYSKRDRGRSALSIAVDLALELGMNWDSYATVYGEGCPVLQESWRRTWWGLYITDATLAANHNATTFKLWGVATDVSLPCEEIDYSRGQVPRPQSLRGFDNREFADEELVYSSFAYMIDIYRIVGRVMALFEDSNVVLQGDTMAIRDNANATNQKLAIADTKLANWDCQLPQSKRQPIRPDGEVDSLTFSAHLMKHWLVLALHRPRSLLSTRPEETGKLCLSIRNHPLANCTAVEVHTLKCMRAADSIASLITIPAVFVKQTPFATCAIAVAIAAHVAACSDALSEDQIAPVKDRIRLCLGLARHLGEIWPFADARFQEAKTAARGVFGSAKQSLRSSSSGANPTPESSSLSLGAEASIFEQPVWNTPEHFLLPNHNISLADIDHTLSQPTVWNGWDAPNTNWSSW